MTTRPGCVGENSWLRATDDRRVRAMQIEKRAMPKMLAHLESGESGTAEPSRWTGGRELGWVELRPELVIEVGYDHAAAGRIRHGARFHAFRDDKEPKECKFDHLDEGS